jgi:hypothetical protein
MNSQGVDNLSTSIPDDALAGAISKILEHPELISMVAGVLGGGSAADGTQKNESRAVSADTSSTPSDKDASDALAPILPILGKLSSISGDSTSFKHEPLLKALKPYLSKSRSDTVNYIIRISKLSSVINGMR